MKPKKIWANLGVNEIDKTQEFYTALGFKPNGSNNGKELVSFLIGSDDFVVHFFQKNILKDSMKGEVADLTRGNEVIFTLWSESREEVDSWAKEVLSIGGRIFNEPVEF